MEFDEQPIFKESEVLCMVFKITRSSDWDRHKEEVEINTLEELLEFQEKCQHPIIIRRDDIEIYDYYRE